MNDFQEAMRQYQALCERVPLKEIRSEAEYDAAVAVLNELLDAGGADENHLLADVVNALGFFRERKTVTDVARKLGMTERNVRYLAAPRPHCRRAKGRTRLVIP